MKKYHGINADLSDMNVKTARCSRCKSHISPNDKYCHKCGKQL